MGKKYGSIDDEIESLRRTLRILRSENGCAWDRERSIDDIISNLIDEAYELLHAEKSKDYDEVEEELADVIFLIVFIHDLLLEKRDTSLPELISSVHRKIISRHPHVFGSVKASNAKESLEAWERVKKEEKGAVNHIEEFESAAAELPVLRRAASIQKKAAEIGFDWPDHRGILDKLNEELEELDKAMASGDRSKVKEEVGDILFTVVNLCRNLDMDAENALAGTSAKFARRFAYMIESAKRSGRELASYPLDEMEELWQKSKLD